MQKAAFNFAATFCSCFLKTLAGFGSLPLFFWDSIFRKECKVYGHGFGVGIIHNHGHIIEGLLIKI